ncbi:MAG: CoA-binding protein [Sphingobacteriales bacterium]
MHTGEELNPSEILKTAKSILLIDWPDKSVPLALLNAGFNVFCYSPEGYTKAELKASGAEKSHLAFQDMANLPGDIDIVNVYRPEEELPGIIQNNVIPLGAKVLWLHPPLISEPAKGLAAKHNLVLIQGFNIVELAGK